MGIRTSINLSGRSGLLILFVSIFSFFHCDEDEKPVYLDLLPIVPAMIEPGDSLVKVGDTLSVKLNFSDSILNYFDQKRYRFENFNFGQNSLICTRLVDKNVSLADAPTGWGDFDFYTVDGALGSISATFVDFITRYNAEDDRYYLDLKLLPKKPGVFCLRFLGGNADRLDFRSIDFGRTEDGRKIRGVPRTPDVPRYKINNGLTNFDLFLKHCKDISEGPPDDYMWNDAHLTFTFRVVE